MRITANLIQKLLAAGKDAQQIIADYPELKKEDINETIKYTAWLVSEKTIYFAGKRA